MSSSISAFLKREKNECLKCLVREGCRLQEVDYEIEIDSLIMYCALRV